MIENGIANQFVSIMTMAIITLSLFYLDTVKVMMEKTKEGDQVLLKVLDTVSTGGGSTAAGGRDAAHQEEYKHQDRYGEGQARGSSAAAGSTASNSYHAAKAAADPNF